MASSDQMTMAYGEEATYGGALLAAKLKRTRYTSEGLKQDQATTRSAEITGDRQTTKILRTDINANGPVNIELSYGTHNQWFEMLFCSAGFSAAEENISDAITISFQSISTSSTSYAKILDSANGLTPYNVNQWIKVSGSASNNVVCKIISVSDGELEVVSITGDLVDEAAGESVTINQGGQIVNGSSLRSMVIERNPTDIPNHVIVERGMSVDQGTLSVTPEAIINGSFSFVGQKEEHLTATVGDGADTAAPTTDVLNAIDNILGVLQNNVALPATQFSFTMQNNIRGRKKLGFLGAFELKTGEIVVSGTVQEYLANKLMMNQFLSDSDMPLAIAFQDEAGNTFVLDMPQAKFTSGTTVNPGKSQDIIADMAWEAYKHPTEGITARLVAWPAA